MTRSKGRVPSDPEQNTQQLTEQLRSLGLYAAPTLGDGNCLFRALSDQLYGSPSRHVQLRRDVCDWIEHHRQRYEPFCEDERGLTVHLECMRQQGTYGGHLELSAFAHFARRNVKVIQPGLVYVIEWNAGGDEADTSVRGLMGTQTTTDEAGDPREQRRLRRQQKREETCGEAVQEESPEDTVYVAYHDWEHFSSVRNLRGPHAGLPHVCELAGDVAPPSPSSPTKRKPTSRVISKSVSKTSPLKGAKRSSMKVKAKEVTVPALIPLPDSRSPSPETSDYLTQVEVDSVPSIPVAVNPELMSLGSASLRVHRSPKRSFDESSGSSLSDVVAKRTRSSQQPFSRPDDERHDAIEVEDPAEESTPELSAPGSSNSSPLSSPASSPRPMTPPLPEPEEKPLTRRQRKALGLPKSKSALMAKRASATGAGVIVIPGGRCGKKSNSKPVTTVRVVGDDEEGSVQDEEWKRNGSGRLDIRGFRELRI
ncbi:hypothetical protein EDC04DRAFT_2923950 [Pisolithus marmoratus]|nr:hypothetical protein EDC04DRAFT_2923950 [Pisolithus marmoratus]